MIGYACGLGIEGSGWVAAPGARRHERPRRRRGRCAPRRSERRRSCSMPASSRSTGRTTSPSCVSPAWRRARCRLADAVEGTPGGMLGYPGNGPYTETAVRVGRVVQIVGRDAYGHFPTPRQCDDDPRHDPQRQLGRPCRRRTRARDHDRLRPARGHRRRLRRPDGVPCGAARSRRAARRRIETLAASSAERRRATAHGVNHGGQRRLGDWSSRPSMVILRSSHRARRCGGRADGRYGSSPWEPARRGASGGGPSSFGRPLRAVLKLSAAVPIPESNSGSGTDGNHLLTLGVREGAASDSPPFSFLAGSVSVRRRRGRRGLPSRPPP